jgi:hypothetical protein
MGKGRWRVRYRWKCQREERDLYRKGGNREEKRR